MQAPAQAPPKEHSAAGSSHSHSRGRSQHSATAQARSGSGGRITTFPAPPARSVSVSRGRTTSDTIFDAVTHHRQHLSHMRCSSMTPRRVTPRVPSSAAPATSTSTCPSVPALPPRVSSYASYNSLNDCTSGILTTQHSMHSARGSGDLHAAQPCGAAALALPTLRTPRQPSPPPKPAHACGTRALGDLDFPIGYNSTLDVHDCQVLSCSASASPDSHGAPTDTPRCVGGPGVVSVSIPRQLLWDDHGARGSPRRQCMAELAQRLAVGSARQSISSATEDPKKTARMLSLLEAARDAGAVPCTGTIPTLSIPGRKSLGARTCCGISAESTASSTRHSHGRAAEAHRADEGHAVAPEVTGLISAHCHSASGCCPMRAQLRASPFSMSSFCGSDRSGFGSDNPRMHGEYPGCSGSETSEDLDSDPFLSGGTHAEFPAASEATPSPRATVCLPPRRTSAERVLSYDPGDPQSHVFRTFLHVPEPPARAGATAEHLPRCFCGGGDTLYGSACGCGGVSSFAHPDTDSAMSRSHMRAASREGTCEVKHGMSLMDDTSDSEIVRTPTVTDAGDRTMDMLPASWRGEASRTAAATRRVPPRISSPALSEGTACDCGDVLDSGVLMDTAPRPPAHTRPAAVPPLRTAMLRPDAGREHAVFWESFDAARSMSETFPLPRSDSTIMLTSDAACVLACYGCGLATNDSVCSSAAGVDARGLAVSRRGRRAEAAPHVSAASRHACVEVQTPRRTFGRVLRERVVPRLPLAFINARRHPPRSTSAEPRRGCIAAV